MSEVVDRQALDDEIEEEGFGFDDVLRVLRRHWRWILATAVTLAAIAAQILMFMPNQYVASATVQVQSGGRHLVDNGSGGNGGPGTAAIESEVEVLRSADLALTVIDRLKLRDDKEFNAPGPIMRALVWLGLTQPIVVSEPPAVGDIAERQAAHKSAVQSVESVRDYLRETSRGLRDPRRDEFLKGFLASLKARRVRNSSLIEISFQSTDAVKASRIANAIVDLYIEAQIGAKDRSETLASRLLDRRLIDLREKLSKAERRLEGFKSENDLFDSGGQFVLDKQLTRETETLVQARNRTAEARARFEQAQRLRISGGDTSALEDVAQSQAVNALRAQLGRALSQQAQLRTKYGPRHPEMIRVNADVAKARTELISQIDSIVSNFRTEFQIAQTREQQLEANLVALKRRITNSKDKIWQLEELTRDTTALRRLYESLLARAKEAKQNAGLQLPDARVVQHATVPLTPKGPKRKQFILLAFIGGLMVSFGTAFLLEMLRPGFESGREAEKQLLLEQVGQLPAFPDIGPSDPMRNARLIVAEPQSHYAEAMRSLAHLVSARRAMPQVLLVMSALNGEGRSTTASNLAVQFAISGKRALLVDADLRQSGLSHTLGIVDMPGLVDVIEGRCPPSQAILRDATTGLHVLPGIRSAQSNRSPVELLNSQPAFGLFDAMRSHFDVIVIDAPPLLPMADARILSDICDSGLMVVKWRQSARSHVKQALRALGPNQSKLIGVVMCGIDEAEYAAQVGISQTPPTWSGRGLKSVSGQNATAA